MSRQKKLLPAGFEDLEPFAETWAVAGTAARARRRDESTEAERIAFYDAAGKWLAPALDYLDRKPLPAFSDEERRLLDLIMSLGHVSLAIELQGDAEARHMDNRRCLKITRAIADEPPSSALPAVLLERLAKEPLPPAE